MNEREIKGIGIVVGVGLLGMAVLNGVYRSGVEAGLARSGNPAAFAHDGFGGFGFPPFPLLLIGAVAFFVWRRRGAGGGPAGPSRGPGGGRPPRLIQEFHQRLHESGPAPAPVASDRPEGEGGDARTVSV